MNGILIKGAEPLENAHKIKAIMFDKTGTITKGLLEVAKIWIEGDAISPSIILSAIGCAETNSEHPIATAITKYIREAIGSELTATSQNFQAVPGCGLRCTVSNLADLVAKARSSSEMSNFESLISAGSSGIFTVNNVKIEVSHAQNMRLGKLIGISSKHEDASGDFEVIIGNREWMIRNGFIISSSVDRSMSSEEELGRSAVLCAINGKYIFVIKFAVLKFLINVF